MAEGSRQERLAELVAAQRGAVRTDQLQEIGFTEAQISHRVATGIWQRQHHGLYCAGDPALIPLAAESAALLAVGEGSLLSHGSAGAIWGLCERPADQVSVTLIGRRARGRHGISLRCLDKLPRADMSIRQGLRLTAPGRTIIDLPAGAGTGELEVMLEVAWERRLVTEATLSAAIERAPTRIPAGRGSEPC